MSNATLPANARTMPEVEPSSDHRPPLSRRGILGALASSFGAAATLAASPAIAQAVLPTQRLPLAESPEFIGLVDRLRENFFELPNVEAEEKAALQRFVANAPLPSIKSRPRAGQSDVRIKIVRERQTLDDVLKKSKLKNPGDPISLSVAVDSAYHELRTNPPGTKEGDAYRRMAGVSWRYEVRLFGSARDTGYAPALNRRLTVENDLRAAIDALLQHKPKTVNGLRMQAAACAMDPDVRWNGRSRTQVFLLSAMEFRVPEEART